jgi:hypothetical protein
MSTFDVIEAQYGEMWPWTKGTRLEVTGQSTGTVEVRASNSIAQDYPVLVKQGYGYVYIGSKFTTNQSFDLEQGEYEILVQTPVEFRQNIKVEPYSEICIQVPQSLGRIKIGTSSKPGDIKPVNGGFSHHGAYSVVDTWGKGHDQKPKDWKNGTWKQEGGTFTGDKLVHEIPAGMYGLKMNDFDSELYGEKERAFEVLAGRQTEVIMKYGSVGMAIKDFQGKLLLGRKTIEITKNGKQMSMAVSADDTVQVRPNSYNCHYVFGPVDVVKKVQVTCGSQSFETIETGRVRFDKLREDDRAVKVAIYPQDRNVKIRTDDISTGEYIDLPAGRYTYSYKGLYENTVHLLTVAAGKEQRIKPPKTEGYLSIIWPNILSQYGKLSDWNFTIEVNSLSGRKVEPIPGDEKPAAYLPKGDYLLHISGRYRLRGEYYQDMRLRPMRISIKPDDPNEVKVPMGRLTLKRSGNKDVAYELSQSGKKIEDIYLDSYYTRHTFYLSPGTGYMVRDMNDDKRKWTVNILDGKSYEIQ